MPDNSLISLPFLHPLGSIFIASIIAIMTFSLTINNYLNKRLDNSYNLGPPMRTVNYFPSVIIGVVFIIWFSHFEQFATSTVKAVQWLLKGEGEAPIVRISKETVAQNYSAFELISRIFKNNGQDIIFGIIAAIAIFYLVYKYFIKKQKIETFYIFLCLSVYSSYHLFSFSTIFGVLLGTGSPEDFLLASGFVGFLGGTVMYELIATFSGYKYFLLSSILFILVLVSAIFGLFNILFIPIIDQADVQVSFKE